MPPFATCCIQACVIPHGMLGYCSILPFVAAQAVSLHNRRCRWLIDGHARSLTTSLGVETELNYGSSIPADMAVESCSGDVDLKRVAGGRARVTISDGGGHCQLRIGVLQCVNATIDSGGSDIIIKQIAAVPDMQDSGNDDGPAAAGVHVRLPAQKSGCAQEGHHDQRCRSTRSTWAGCMMCSVGKEVARPNRVPVLRTVRRRS